MPSKTGSTKTSEMVEMMGKMCVGGRVLKKIAKKEEKRKKRRRRKERRKIKEVW